VDLVPVFSFAPFDERGEGVTMLDLLTNALGGGALGVLLRIGNGFFENYKAGQDHKRKLEEARVMAEIAADKSKWDAFTASQQAATPPANISTWAANVITLFRPAITFLLLVLVTIVFFRVTETEQAEMIDEIQFCAFNCIGWWFGDRMTRKR
jgi:hypothetical protein